MKRLHRPLLAIFAVSALGASTAHADEQPLPEQRVVVLLGELATNVGDAGDCDNVATAIRTWSDTHRVELPQLVAATKARAGALAPELEAQLEAELAPAMEKIFTAAVTCAEHEATVAAFESLDAVMADGTEPGATP